MDTDYDRTRYELANLLTGLRDRVLSGDITEVTIGSRADVRRLPPEPEDTAVRREVTGTHIDIRYFVPAGD